MTIQLNGEQHDIQGGMSVAALLRHLEIQVDQVAVEVNKEIMDKGGFETRLLQEGDQVEVMSFIGGGAEKFSCDQNRSFPHLHLRVQGVFEN